MEKYKREEESNLPHGFENTLVDEVCFGSFNLFQYVMYFLRGTEPIVMHAFSLASGSFTFATPICSFFFFKFNMCFHFSIFFILRNNNYICNENPKRGGFPPLGSELNSDNLFEVNLDCQEPNFERNFQLSHCVLDFHFLYSFQGFRLPFCNPSLITLQIYGFVLKYANKIKDIFQNIFSFSLRKCLFERELIFQ